MSRVNLNVNLSNVNGLDKISKKNLEKSHRKASQAARVDGYKESARQLAAETGKPAVVWKRSHRVFSSIDPGLNEARAWIGLNPYPVVRNPNSRKIAFRDDFDPGEAVSKKMAETYVRLLEAEIKSYLG